MGDIAQLGERRLCKPEVAGSIPAISTNQVSTQVGPLSEWDRPVLRRVIITARLLADVL